MPGRAERRGSALKLGVWGGGGGLPLECLQRSGN